MTSLTPYQVFAVCHSIFLHFNSSYDYQKYQGKSRYTEANFDKRKDRYSYHKLAREFAHFDKELLEYYVAWMNYNRDKWVTTDHLIIGIQGFELEWLNYSKHKEENFKRDMVKIYRHHDQPMYVFDQLMRGEIHWQTLLILNKYSPIIYDMNSRLWSNPLWDSKYKKITKFMPFYYQYDIVLDTVFKQYVPETQCQQDLQEK